MAEAEDVITDLARHASVHARRLWLRHRGAPAAFDGLALADVAERLDLLVAAVLGQRFRWRASQPSAPPTFLTTVWRRGEGPRVAAPLAATDGRQVWLPPTLTHAPGLDAMQHYKVLALQQAMRARLGAVPPWRSLDDPRVRAVYQVLVAQAADAELAHQLPGLRAPLERARALALSLRPPLSAFPPHRQELEAFVRASMAAPVGEGAATLDAALVARARALAAGMRAPTGRRLLYRDLWTGEFREPEPGASAWDRAAGADAPSPDDTPQRSARLERRPEVRAAPEDEDDRQPGAWMVQTAQPHEQAEDPVGLQRPTDRDASTAAEELADAVSELPEARLVSSPTRAKEVLLSDAPPEAERTAAQAAAGTAGETVFRYPEWDHRERRYIEQATTVHLRTAEPGPKAWVDAALARHHAQVRLVRRHFEMLKAHRLRLYRQVEGDEIDIDACVEAQADFRAGLPLPLGLYEHESKGRRDMALQILVDISGSTDAWVGAGRRIVDVEREALLLVAVALQALGEPYAIHAFSGEGPRGVVVWTVKDYAEPFGETVLRRIASLEPQHYTRAGAAIRHTTAALLRQPAHHRMLLLLSDGKPNDVDLYEGPYGMEDTRQAVNEARLQGLHAYCLAVDRQAAAYMPALFGRHRYALLPRPEVLPTALLNWIKRVVLA